VKSLALSTLELADINGSSINRRPEPDVSVRPNNGGSISPTIYRKDG
jgi:hypothetical protein